MNNDNSALTDEMTKNDKKIAMSVSVISIIVNIVLS